MYFRFTIKFQTFFCLIVAAVFLEPNAFAGDSPTLDEIAQANTIAWAGIETVDMEFAIINETVIDDTESVTVSLQNHWLLSPEKERLIRIYDLGDGDSLLSDSLLDADALREHQVTKDVNGVLFCGTILPTINPIWQSKVNLAPYLLRYPCGEIDLDTTKTLAWIIKNWPTRLEGSHQHEGNTFWHLLVQCPVEPPWCGGLMRIEVNENKSFLVQRVTVSGIERDGYVDEKQQTTVEMEIDEFVSAENGTCYFPSGFVSRQFAEPRKASDSPIVIYREIPTKVIVNDVLPENTFDFKFEKHEIVTRYNSLSEITAVYLWGDDNQPMHTFASYEELDRWQLRQDIMALVTDYINLSRIIGHDLGHMANHVITVGHQRLMAWRHHKQEKLRELAPLPIDKVNAELPIVVPAQLLTDDTPVKSAQTIETAVAIEAPVNEIAPTTTTQ